MPNTRNRSRILEGPYLQVGGIILLIILAALMMWFNSAGSTQAIGVTAAKIRFYGEYRIGDGQWQEIKEGQHISSTNGDVTLRGNLHMLTPDGEYIGIYRGRTPIAFYSDHINLTIYDGKDVVHVMEAPLAVNIGPDMCSQVRVKSLSRSLSTIPISLEMKMLLMNCWQSWHFIRVLILKKKYWTVNKPKEIPDGSL